MLERAFDAQFGARIIGIDEAGRGPWAGPVVAGAVMWPEGATLPDALNDSKKLSAKKRDALYDIVTTQAHYSIGIASAAEIDQMNILQATLLAMQRAYDALNVTPDCALIDGNKTPSLPCPAQAIVKGDGKSPSIAAASIIAKVTRDRMMADLARTYPEYGFERHAGYGTAQHSHALAEHGPCPAHRRSFAPIRTLIEAAA
jgi:ribonuclease HII